jgi:two-component system, OmpR family, alkaline phosphatase synthesis response regulator PhoP
MAESLNKKILIVDDEAYIRLLLEQTLEDLEERGVDLLTVDNGADALKIIADERPELVFLDVMLPKMNGFDVCRAVRRELKVEETFIVLLTAKGQEYDRKTGEEAGANIYMTKPFDPDELLELAKKVMGL